MRASARGKASGVAGSHFKVLPFDPADCGSSRRASGVAGSHFKVAKSSEELHTSKDMAIY